MASGRISVVSLVVLLAVASAAAKEAVVTLDAANFDDYVKDKDFMVVEFYAPWCGHCKSLAPEYEKAAQQLQAEGSSIILAKVDADAKTNKELAQRFGVRGYPTLKILRKGEVSGDYNGPREAAGIVSHVKKLSGPASAEVKTAEEIEDIRKAEKVVVVGLFDKFAGEAFDTFTQLADELREDFAFRHTSSAEALGSPILSPPAVRLFREFESTPADAGSDIFEEEGEVLKAFIHKESSPPVIHFSQDPADQPFIQRAFAQSTNKTLLFLSYTHKELEAYRAAILKEGKAGRKSMHFLIGDADKAEQALKYFSLEVKDTPAVMVHDATNDAKYIKKNVAAAEIGTWLDGFFAGTVAPHVKSEPVPVKNDGPVKVVVGETFEELVVKSSKNVLIEFYAEWCGHCKKLAPIYEEIGRHFLKDNDVVVAKMDYTLNDLAVDAATKAKFPVEGFPTIFLFTAGKESIKYEGDRSRQSIIDFVTKHKTAEAVKDEL